MLSFSAGERASMRLLRLMPVNAVLLVFLLSSSAFLFALPSGRGATGGPDPYGYTWTDSKPVPGVTYNWIDGVTGGKDLLLVNDGCTFNRIPSPVAFKFYNISSTDAYVCANGFIAFNTPTTNPWDTDAFASAFGYELSPSDPGSGHIFAKVDLASSPHRFIATWDGVFTYPTTDRQRFEIVLIEGVTGLDGQILFQYSSLMNPPLNPLIGIDNLGSTSNLYYSSPPENSLAVKFLPPGTPAPGDTLTVRGANLAPPTIEPGMKDVPILRLNVSTATNSVNLRRVRVDVSGIVSLPGDVSRVSIWRDADGDGQLNTARDAFLTSSAPAGSPESAILTLSSPLTVPAGPGKNLIVSYDVALSAVPGDWIGASVVGAGYVTVDPPDNVSSANFPLDTYLPGVRTHIVEGIDSLRATSWSAVNPRNVTQWQTDAPMFAATFDVDKGAVPVDPSPRLRHRPRRRSRRPRRSTNRGPRLLPRPRDEGPRRPGELPDSDRASVHGADRRAAGDRVPLGGYPAKSGRHDWGGRIYPILEEFEGPLRPRRELRGGAAHGRERPELRVHRVRRDGRHVPWGERQRLDGVPHEPDRVPPCAS